MKRLYVVDVSAELYVLADDESDAEDVAQDVVRNGDTETDAAARLVEPGHQVPRDWRDAYPWGNADAAERTVAQIVETLSEDTARLEAFKAHPRLFPDVDPSPLPNDLTED